MKVDKSISGYGQQARPEDLSEIGDDPQASISFGKYLLECVSIDTARLERWYAGLRQEPIQG